MNLRLRLTQAISSVSLSSLQNKLVSPRLVQGIALGLYGTLMVGVAGAKVHHARPRHHKQVAVLQHHTPMDAGTSLATIASGAITADSAARYELHLHHLHTGEDLDVVYRVGNAYVPSAIDKLNHFLRDHRTQDVSHYDPREFDVLHEVLSKLGRPNGVIDIVCGYRTPWSNNFLRTRGGTAAPTQTGVAQHSQHMLAKAIDIRIPGVTTSHLRDVALSLHEGGVGYYPVSQFVHVDVGPVRQWSFGGRGE